MTTRVNAKGYTLGTTKYWNNLNVDNKLTKNWTLEQKILNFYNSIIMNSANFLESLSGAQAWNSVFAYRNPENYYHTFFLESTYPIMLGEVNLNFQNNALFLSINYFFNFDKYLIEFELYHLQYIDFSIDFLSKYLNVNLFLRISNLCIEDFWLSKFWIKKKNKIGLIYKGIVVPYYSQPARVYRKERRILDNYLDKQRVYYLKRDPNRTRPVYISSRDHLSRGNKLILLGAVKAELKFPVKMWMGRRVFTDEYYRKKPRRITNKYLAMFKRSLQRYITRFTRRQGRRLLICKNSKLLKRHKRNQYFTRIIDAGFCIFHSTKFDLILLTRFITYEFQILRKFHRPYIRFLKNFFRYFIYSTRQRMITAVQIVIKGRITPGRRQKRRKQKSIIKLGFVRRSHLSLLKDYCEFAAIHRYGIINIQITTISKKFKIWKKMRFFWKKRKKVTKKVIMYVQKQSEYKFFFIKCFSFLKNYFLSHLKSKNKLGKGIKFISDVLQRWGFTDSRRSIIQQLIKKRNKNRGLKELETKKKMYSFFYEYHSNSKNTSFFYFCSNIHKYTRSFLQSPNIFFYSTLETSLFFRSPKSFRIFLKLQKKPGLALKRFKSLYISRFSKRKRFSKRFSKRPSKGPSKRKRPFKRSFKRSFKRRAKVLLRKHLNRRLDNSEYKKEFSSRVINRYEKNYKTKKSAIATKNAYEKELSYKESLKRYCKVKNKKKEQQLLRKNYRKRSMFWDKLGGSQSTFSIRNNDEFEKKKKMFVHIVKSMLVFSFFCIFTKLKLSLVSDFLIKIEEFEFFLSKIKKSKDFFGQFVYVLEYTTSYYQRFKANRKRKKKRMIFWLYDKLDYSTLILNKIDAILKDYNQALKYRNSIGDYKLQKYQKWSADYREAYILMLKKRQKKIKEMCILIKKRQKFLLKKKLKRI